jgi:hypothetical protein
MFEVIKTICKQQQKNEDYQPDIAPSKYPFKRCPQTVEKTGFVARSFRRSTLKMRDGTAINSQPNKSPVPTATSTGFKNRIPYKTKSYFRNTTTKMQLRANLVRVHSLEQFCITKLTWFFVYKTVQTKTGNRFEWSSKNQESASPGRKFCIVVL